MVTNRKPTGRAASMPGGLAAGTVTAMGTTLMMAAVLAKLIETEVVPEGAVGYGIMATLILSSFLGAMVSARKIKRQRMLVCGLSAGIYFGLLLSLTALFFGGQYSGVGATALLVLCGGALAFFAGLSGERGGKRKKIRIANR